MRSMRSASVAVLSTVAALSLLGCHNKHGATTQPVAPPANAQTVRDIRHQYRQRDPRTQVGLVIATLPDSSLAAVGDVPVRQFRTGDLVTFIDSQQHIIAVGNVVATTSDAVHVKYHPQGANGRAPQEGDLAVKTQS